MALVGQRLSGEWRHLKASYSHCLVVHASCQLEQLAVSFCVVSLTWQLHGRQTFKLEIQDSKLYERRERMSDIEIEGERGREKK